MKTHHHNDKDVADEAGYENDGEGDWNKEQSQSPDHLLILVIEDHHLLCGVELARVLQLNILIRVFFKQKKILCFLNPTVMFSELCKNGSNSNSIGQSLS